MGLRPRARLLVALALLGGLALTGCGGEGDGSDGESPTPSSSADRPDLIFTDDVVVSDDSVQVTYSLKNTGSQPATVLNRVPNGPSGAAVDYDPSAAWVTGDDDEIVVSQQVFPRPDTDKMTWETSAVTGATTLAPGATLDGSVTVPRPFVRFHPYGNDIGDGEIELPDDPSSVGFCLGVIATPLVDGDTRPGNGAGLLVTNDDSTFERQYLFCGDPVPLD